MKDKALLKKRIPELDIARGIAVLLMILDHAMYDLWGLMPMLFPAFKDSQPARLALRYWNWDVRYYVRFVILFVFLALTGICCSLSKSNLKRGLKLLGVALFLTLATWIVGTVLKDPDMTITFGVLHCISLVLILIGLFDTFLKNKWFYLIVGVLLVAFGISIGEPEFVSYSSDTFGVLMLKQIAGLVACGSDCFAFPLYGGQIFIGVFLGKLLYREKKSLIPNAEYRNGPVEFVGRHSLFVYFGHQIVLPVLMAAVLLLAGYSLTL
ncbi:MAG: DUF1624 domain-containing protein [Lachnospiraceae bacterium]|nr:DUF1624 domain-containing protein [Lachnospiraceae bacterium]